jgi:hypothetical protein
MPGPFLEAGLPATPPSPPLVSAGVPISPQPAASQGSNTVVKVILIVLAVIMFLMLLAAGSCFYVAYRVKKKAHEFSQEMGADMPAYTGRKQPCAMISSAEVSAILAAPVEVGEPQGTAGCEYRYGRGGSRRLYVEFTWQGGTMTMKLAHGAMQHISGMETFTAVPGIGDEAYIAPGGSAFMMRKGDVMVNIDLRASGVNLDAAEKIAAKIATRL